MAAVVTVNDVLDGHVGLDVECLDRIYLNGYVPNLQVGGQVVSFMTAHLGNPIPSPAIMEKIGTAFRTAVDRFAADNKIPVVRFGKGDRKIEVMHPYLARQARTGRSGVAAIGIAQEFQNVFAATKRMGDNGVPWFSFTKADRRVTCFYFYVWDADFGPAFVKICSYFPYPIKVWLNGHEWAKRQATMAGIGFTELSNGFATCADPAALQAICDRLGPGTIGVFFEHWMSRLPVPLTGHDRAAGYWWELSMRQVEVSRTLVFDAPRQARGFFEALVADNLDIGRPDQVELVFTGKHERRGRPRTQPLTFKTKVVTRGTEVTVNAFYKNSRIKQYLKHGRALRIETVINSPDDLRCHRRLVHLGELSARARAINRRLLDRLDGLADEPRPGAPRRIGDEQIEQVVVATLERQPADATHWSRASMAHQSGLSKSTVGRIWKAFGLKPHLVDTFKISTDPQFIDKVRDVVGLYLDPPEKALVLCVDEKSQIQALDRSAPVLPMMPGLPERRTHDYLRHGITTLFAALDVATGQVYGSIHRRHRAAEFKKFLTKLDRQIPAELDVHLVCDNYATHKTPVIAKWLDAHPRFHMHHTPTYASWLNQVERWFALLTDKKLRRGTHRSIQALEKDIRDWIAAWNEHPPPFTWTKTADEILERLNSYLQRIPDAGH